MGPIGMPELFMIFIVILVLFGAKKIPELARGFGKATGEFKKAREEFENEINRSINEVDATKEVKGEKPVEKENRKAWCLRNPPTKNSRI